MEKQLPSGPRTLTPEQIRQHYLARLRKLYRLVQKLEKIYPASDFPDVPPDSWRTGIVHVATHINTAPDAELQQMGGSHTALRNLVAKHMALDQHDGDGSASYGNRVLDISWD